MAVAQNLTRFLRAVSPRPALVGMALVAALASAGIFAAAVRQGTDGTQRLVRAQRAVEHLRALPAQLVRVEAYAQLAARGQAPTGALESLSRQLGDIDAEMKALERLVITMSPRQWGLFKQMQEDWAAAQRAALRLAWLAPAELAGQGVSLAQDVSDRSAAVRERAEVLQQVTEDQTRQELAALDAWRRRVQGAGWRLIISACLLGGIAGWVLTWRALPRGSSIAQPAPPPSIAKPAKPAAPAEEPLEQIEEQV